MNIRRAEHSQLDAETLPDISIKRRPSRRWSSDRQYRLLVNSITDYAIYMLSRDGLVISWNAGAERIKGYSETEIVGRHFSAFYTDEARLAGEPQRGLNTALREGHYETQGWRVRQDGTQFWANVAIDPVRNRLGQLIGFAKITRDITALTEARHALDRAREALCQLQKLQAIGHLTGGLAHDFNNLLMAIMGNLELMIMRAPGPDLERFAKNALAAAERGAALTHRMLSFARFQPLNLQCVDISTLLGGMADLLRQSLHAGIDIEVRIPPTAASVWTDAHQLELAILNLVLNARDAIGTSGLIVISAENVTVGLNDRGGLTAGRYLILKVTDTGAGMDADTLSRAMEPFFTTKDAGKGTGLGLPMVFGLAEQSGGRLCLSSVVGEGTTVELWLPQGAPADHPGPWTAGG